MSRKILIAVALCTSLFGCVKDLRDVIQEHRAKVEQQLERVKAVAKAAKAAPPVAGEANAPITSDKLIWNQDHPQGNVAVEYLEDLEDLESYGNVPARLADSGPLNVCAAALSTHRKPYDPQSAATTPEALGPYGAEGDFDRCERIRYVFVIRSLAFSPPSASRKVDGGCPSPSVASDASDAGASDAGASDAGASDAGALDAGTSDAGVIRASEVSGSCNLFDGGYLRAEVLVYELASAKLLGGFSFESESSEKVDVGTKGTSPEADFKEQTRLSLARAGKVVIPNLEVK